ncbi:MAG: 50S ribosomal protein L18Ae [Candidatus Bathyarchaeia archaeon]
MSESVVKRFQVIGEVRKPSTRIPFKKVVSALKLSDALEQVFSDVGSRHKAKRFEIKILRADALEEYEEEKTVEEGE